MRINAEMAAFTKLDTIPESPRETVQKRGKAPKWCLLTVLQLIKVLIKIGNLMNTRPPQRQ